MANRSIYFVVVIALIAPYLYDRYIALSAILSNGPGKLQNLNSFKSHEVKFRDRIRNCEDVLVEEGMGIAFLSCDPGRDRWNTVMGTFMHPLPARAGGDSGRIWIYDYTTPDLPDTEALKALEFINFDNAADLHPLGIEFDAETSTLYVINHSRNSGSVIEVFQVSIPDATATHVQTHKQPLIHAPNSLHVLSPGKLLISNDHYFRAAAYPVLSQIETFSGLPGGTVVYADLQNPSETKILARVPFANGVKMLNSTTVAVASSSKAGIYFYSWSPETHSLQYQTFVRTSAAADNLSVDSKGKLLISGHPFAPGLTVVSKGRAKCDLAGTEDEKKACECTAPSWAAEWSEEGGLKEVYKNDGTEFCSSSTFARDVSRGIGMISGLYDRGLLVVRE
ncbi:calcium-dependent phosphotriesterase [Plenodomus tracheiphilus IPT5]|uniref:Calcium-dependent phosphotriesterase n=1 Tax=Plenodomus tracheiphilus IPT5 TaxID=1408161 RepID=A0A6A7BQJ8_9PLEO|nr:calcium-dependent phosphotriesterase [Plenodomus tracheiphilus IPT5]